MSKTHKSLTALLASTLILAGPALAQDTPAEGTVGTTPYVSPSTAGETEPGTGVDGTAAEPAAPIAPDTTTIDAAPVTTVAAPEGYSPVPDFAALTADQLNGIALHGPDQSDIGKIADIELGTDGVVTGLIADIGGFLGIGAHRVKLVLDDVAVFSNEDGRLIAVSSLSEEALKALPAYEAPET